MADEIVTAELHFAHGMRSTLSTRLHTWVGDGHQSDDLPDPAGPNPFVQLLGALGSCMVMTVKMYAGRKAWPVRTVRAVLEDVRGAGQPLEAVRVTLHVEGDLDERQRQRVLEISQRCPVHRTLAPTVTIETTLADPAQV